MKTYQISVLLILLLSPLFADQGISQDTKEAFESDLLSASREKDTPKLETIIEDNRLWVKPVVDHQISIYINETLAGQKRSASRVKKSTERIARTFQGIHGERSLSIAVNYLDGWNRDNLRKKQLADSLAAQGTKLRIDGEQETQAIQTYHQALGIYQELDDVRGQAVVWGGLAYLYFNRDVDTCLSYYQAALEARKHVDDKQLTASALNGIGQVHFYFLPQSEKTLDYFLEAAEIRKEIGDWNALGNSYILAGWTCEDKAELEKALLYYDQAFLAYKNAGDSVRMANARINTAMILKLQGRYTETLASLEEAYTISLGAKDTRGLGDALVQMSNVYALLGDYTTAVEKCTQALPVFEEANDSWGMAGVYNNLGITLQNAGRTERAAEFYEQALTIYESLNEQQDILIVVNNLGTIEFDRKNYKQAEIYHARGVEICRSLEVPSDEMKCLLNLANDQNRLGKLEEAMANYDASLELAYSLNSPEVIWKIMVGKGENYQLKGDYSAAIEFNEKGLSGIEKIRGSLPQEDYRTSYMARERVAYEDVIHMLGELHAMDNARGYDLMAFQYTQRCKSRTFLDLMNQKVSMESEDLSSQLITPTTLEKFTASLQEKNAVVLEFSVGDSSSYVWIITADAYELIKLPARKTLQEQVETLRFALVNPSQDNRDFFIKSSQYLYNQFIRPAEKYLTKKSKLIILPDGILHYLPFEVLITEDVTRLEDPDYQNLPYLVNDHPISYGHSSSVLLHVTKKPKAHLQQKEKEETLMAFGDPVYEPENAGSIQDAPKFSRLLNSGEEVKTIVSLFPENSCEVFLRGQARKNSFLEYPGLEKFKYIHFATHGVVDEENPDNSSLVLSLGNNPSDDGMLKAAELSALQLNADLVTLSACQSGLGKLVRGEGIIGLTRAFMHAGTPSVLASLWNVSDASTTLLMQRFYENLIQKKLSKTDALRQAQISMIREEPYAHPFFWAPFVLTGDWN